MQMRFFHLPPQLDGDYLAVIEATAASRCKFKYSTTLEAFILHSLLPTGTSFPYAFGFIPSTLADDGDPLDVVVLADEPPPCGTVVPCRIAGILRAQQREHGKKVRNDRLLGIATCTERFGECRRLKDISGTILDRIAEFFAFYHAEQGKSFEPLDWKGHAAAERAIGRGRKRFDRRYH